MKRYFAVLLPAAILATNLVLASDDEQYLKYEADCKKYAQEDSVPVEDMDAYMEQCLKDMSDSSVEPSENPPASES